MQAFDPLADLLIGDADLLRQLALRLFLVRNKLMQRRVDRADGHRAAVHRLKDPLEVLSLKREELCESDLPALQRVGKDHFAHRTDLPLTKEHVFRTAEADPFGTEGNGIARLIGLVRVRSDLQPAILVGPRHDRGILRVHGGILRIERLVDQHLQYLGGLGGNLPFDHLTRRAIKRDPIPLLDQFPLHAHGMGSIVDFKRRTAGHAHFPHLPCNERRV